MYCPSSVFDKLNFFVKAIIYSDVNQQQLSHNSVSSISLVLEIKGKFRVNCELKRHLSPKTVGMISRSMPHKGNVHKFGSSGIYFEIQIASGVERSRNEFKKGDIAFYPVANYICFFYADTKNGKSMTPIGKILTGIDELEQATIGDEVLFYDDIG